MKNFIKNKFHQILLTALLIIPNLVFAENINLGLLDIRLINNNEILKTTLTPGKTETHEIRISNFSTETKNISLNFKNAEFHKKNKNFQTSSITSSMNSWIEIPQKNFTLKSKESVIVPIKINPDKLAGVGLHTGALIIRDSKPESGLTIEKGLRIYATIPGTIKPSITIGETSISETKTHIINNIEVVNTGNTDQKGELKLIATNIFGGPVENQKQIISLSRNEKKQISFISPKPYLGLMNFEFAHNFKKHSRYSSLGKISIIPIEIQIISMIIFSILCGVIYFLLSKKIEYKKYLLPIKLKKLFALSTVSIITMFSYFTVKAILPNNDNLKYIKAQSIEEFKPSDNWYELTIKIGDLEELNPRLRNKNLQTIIDQIIFSNAETQKIEEINTDSNDNYDLKDNKLSFRVSNQTGEHTGIKILLKPQDPNLYPGITMEERTGRQNIILTADKTFHYEHIFQIDQQKISFQTKAIPKPKELNTSLVDEISETKQSSENIINPEKKQTEEIDFNLIPNNFSTLNEVLSETLISEELNSTPDLKEEIVTLENLISETSSTPELHQEYIPSTDYVEKVSTANALTTISADTALINALINQPEIIKEISSTPDLNFIFLPKNKIEFSPQKFSFENEKITKQQIGEIIFVQNKNSGWNTYVEVSDFISQNGRHITSSDNIMIEPGEIKIIKQSNTNTSETTNNEKFETGEITSFANENEALLINVKPQSDTDAIFSMTPTLTVKIPQNTPPGKYKANLKITTL